MLRGVLSPILIFFYIYWILHNKHHILLSFTLEFKSQVNLKVYVSSPLEVFKIFVSLPPSPIFKFTPINLFFTRDLYVFAVVQKA